MKLSIIIPIYKVEDYIEECLNSILSQLPKNVQIICINDGSPDKSFEKAQKLVSNYSEEIQNQFIFISQKNQGLSVARNTGIQAAKGEYIGFLDSDDMLLPDYFDTILSTLEKHNCDILDFNIITSEGDILKTHEDSFNSVFNLMQWFAWARIYKKEVFLNNRFTPNIIYEDLDLIPKLYLLSKKFIHNNKKLYWYRLNKKGITQSFDSKNNDHTIKSLYTITDNYRILYKHEQANSSYYALLFLQSYFMLCVNTVRRRSLRQALIYLKEFKNELIEIDFATLPLDKTVVDKRIIYFYKNPHYYLFVYNIYCELKRFKQKNLIKSKKI